MGIWSESHTVEQPVPTNPPGRPAPCAKPRSKALNARDCCRTAVSAGAAACLSRALASPPTAADDSSALPTAGNPTTVDSARLNIFPLLPKKIRVMSGEAPYSPLLSAVGDRVPLTVALSFLSSSSSSQKSRLSQKRAAREGRVERARGRYRKMLCSFPTNTVDTRV